MAVPSAVGGSRVRFHEASLEGAYLIETEAVYDERGFFARTFCFAEFAECGLETSFVQHSMSCSKHTYTLRGMHFQDPPYAEVKLIRCIVGALYDVIVDVRPHSPTYLRWEAFELSSSNHRQLYVPGGFAHGFQTLTDDATVSYLISEFYTPEAANGMRFDDPTLAIEWPAPPRALSERDRSWPLVAPQATAY